MKALGKDPTQRFPTCSAFAAAVRVGMAGGTVELPADANAGVGETVLLDPQAASGSATVVVETAATAGPPIIPAAGRRGSRRWALAAAAVLAASGSGRGWRRRNRLAGHGGRCESGLAGPGSR